MRVLILTMILLGRLGAAQEIPEDVAIALTSLRANERASLEKTLGPAQKLPTYRADLTLNLEKQTVTGFYSASLPARETSYLRALPNGSHDTAIVLHDVKLNNIETHVTQEPGALIKLDSSSFDGGTREIRATLRAQIPLQQKNAKDFGAFSISENVVSLVSLIPMEPCFKTDGMPTSGPSGIGDLGVFPVANIIFSIEVPKGWRAISAGILLGEIPTRNQTTKYSFGASGVRELPVFVVRNFVSHEELAGEIVVEAWASDKIAAKKLATLAKEALVLIEKNVGPYPWKSFRIVEVPLVNGAGGMEFQGLVTISSAILHGVGDIFAMFGGSQVDPMLSQMFSSSVGPLFENILEFTVNHEVAHQYFAGLVGNDAVDDPIVDEPIAQFMAVKIIEWKHGSQKAREAIEMNLKMAFQLSRMMGEPDVKARQATSAFQSTMQYAGSIYAKAPLLHVEQEKLVSSDVFFKALKNYVSEKRFGFATSHDFSLALQKMAPLKAKKLKALEKRYWDEIHGDEDVGQFDISKLLGQFGNTNGFPGFMGPVKGLDKNTLKALEDAMKALGGE